MKKLSELSFDSLDISHIPAHLLLDSYWKQCITLALNSRSQDQRYGALIVSGDAVIGVGWNRLLKRGESFPFPTSFFLHAEKSAIGDAIKNFSEEKLRSATLYVAGLLVSERRPLIRSSRFTNSNTCKSCTRHYARFGLEAAFYSEGGWVKCSGTQAYANAIKNSRELKVRGITKREYRKEISI